MRSFSASFAFIVSFVLIMSSGRALGLTPIPHESPYLDSNVANLSHFPLDIGDEDVAHLLDILENHGLTKNFGIYRLHTPLDHNNGEVLYETGNNIHSEAKYRNFSDIENNAAPYTYRIDLATNNEYQLLPLGYGPINNNVEESRLALADAVDKGFLSDFYTALVGISEQDVVGISLILDIHRNALAKGMAVGYRVAQDQNITVTDIKPKIEQTCPTNVRRQPHTKVTRQTSMDRSTTFYTRGVASGDPFEIALSCWCCWCCR